MFEGVLRHVRDEAEALRLFAVEDTAGEGQLFGDVEGNERTNRLDLVFTADEFGLEQKISVGPMSGKSNVIWFLEHRDIEPTAERVAAVLDKAKNTPRLLTENEVLDAAGTVRAKYAHRNSNWSIGL